MHDSPDPHKRTTYGRLTWTDILLSYAMAAALPVLLWSASDPVTAGVLTLSAAFVVVTARRTRELARCLRECRSVAFDLPGTVSVTVAWGPTCDGV